MEIVERGFGTMTIGGKERGFHIGTYQAKLFCKVRNIELRTYVDEIGKFTFENNMENNVWINDYLYSALAAYDTFKDQVIDYTPVTVCFWSDMAGPEEIAKLFEVMAAMKRDTPKKSEA
ncbi:hypothetical protein [Hymenobacter sublimis]|uniref:Uncharacterized protein n=1 Tax=Hymenobacter sublimis TaxID=2933777 RepID=A0ABY4JCJ4_9BACT|nr:hypothetical protein [Hymenobacter sublimis]UPL50530.1 hypothetical protein MWH26_06385 [Hymenobacter sublimis]